MRVFHRLNSLAHIHNRVWPLHTHAQLQKNFPELLTSLVISGAFDNLHTMVLARADVNLAVDGITPVSEAAAARSLRELELLLEHGGNPNLHPAVS